MKFCFAAAMVALPFSITTSTWGSPPGTHAELEEASSVAGQNPLAPPSTTPDPSSYSFREYRNPPAPPGTPPDPKSYLSLGANLNQWIDSVLPTGKTLSDAPEGKVLPDAPKGKAPSDAPRGKTLSEQCKAIQAEAIKCLRAAEAKEQWSNVCKPHVDKYVKRCKQRGPKVNWVNPADPAGRSALPI